MKKKNKTVYKIIIGLGVVIVLGLIANNIFIVQPKIQRETKLAGLKTNLIVCESDAFGTYDLNWTNECKTRGLKDECSLPKYNADSFNQIYKDEKDRCFDTYKLEVGLVK